MVAVLGIAGWSSPVARQAHNLKVAGSNPAPATISGYSLPFPHLDPDPAELLEELPPAA